MVEPISLSPEREPPGRDLRGEALGVLTSEFVCIRSEVLHPGRWQLAGSRDRIDPFDPERLNHVTQIRRCRFVVLARLMSQESVEVVTGDERVVLPRFASPPVFVAPQSRLAPVRHTKQMTGKGLEASLATLNDANVRDQSCHRRDCTEHITPQTRPPSKENQP